MSLFKRVIGWSGYASDLFSGCWHSSCPVAASAKSGSRLSPLQEIQREEEWTELLLRRSQAFERERLLAEASEEIFPPVSPCDGLLMPTPTEERMAREPPSPRHWETEASEMSNTWLISLEEREMFTHHVTDDPRENAQKIIMFLRIVEAKVAEGRYKAACHSEKLGDTLEFHVLPLLKEMQERAPWSSALTSIIRRLERFNQLPMVVPFTIHLIEPCMEDLLEILREVELLD